MSWDDMLLVIERYEALFLSGDLSDVTLVVGSTEIQAHKAILGAHSPVFAAMFKSECTEQRDGRVVIEDIDEEVLRVMVHYMYSCKVPEEKLAELAEPLLIAADKYALDNLKSLCSEQLISQISVDSAARLYLFVDTYNISQLKSRCIEFINANCSAVRTTDGWQALLTERPQLVVQLYTDFTKKSDYKAKNRSPTATIPSPPPSSSAPVVDLDSVFYSRFMRERAK